MGNSNQIDNKFKEKYNNRAENGSYIYSVEIGEKKPGESRIFRSPYLGENPLMVHYNPEIQTLQELFLSSVDKFPNREFLGTLIDGTYKYKTYTNVKEEATEIGSALIKQNLFVEDKVENVKLIGIYSKTRAEWLTVELATILYGMQGVPIYDTLGEQGTKFIFNQTKMNTLACSLECLLKFIQFDYLGFVTNIICFDKINLSEHENIQKWLTTNNIKFYNLDDIRNIGKQAILEYPQVKPNDVYALSYTSGTTGDPKGVMITHQNLMAGIASLQLHEIGTFFDQEQLHHFGYLPLAHIFEKGVSHIVITHGGMISYYSGDIFKLKAEMALCKPSIFFSVPRLYNRIADSIVKQFEKQNRFLRYIIQKGLQKKLKDLVQQRTYSNFLFDKLVFNKIKNILGGKVQILVSSSAPLPEDKMNLLQATFGIPMYNGYGCTETAGILVNNLCDPHCDHNGGPFKGNEIKLLDVPECNYYSDDKDSLGNKNPRGEILVRGPAIFKGYYKEPQKTAEALDNEGWYHTGDIAEVIYNNKISGAFRVIDRKKNIFKLSQGEYVATEKVENTYLKMKELTEIFIYGDSYQSYLLGIIVPDMDYIVKYAKENNIEGTNKELCQNKQIIKHFQLLIDDHGKKEGLFGFEQAKKIILHPQAFQELNILTPSGKLQRHLAKVFFQQDINRLYDLNN